MRIPCPFCGERDLSEFSYLGDAACTTSRIPTQALQRRNSSQAVYLRDNPAGPHRELWYHAFGCRRWLQVTRNTRTHEILAVAFAGASGSL